MFAENVMTTSESQLDVMLNVNLKSAINVTQIVAEGMIQEGIAGSIVNVSSAGSKMAAPVAFAYLLSKSGMDHTTRMFAVELGKHKIRVNAVLPGLMLTDMGKGFYDTPEKVQAMANTMPIGKVGEVEDVTNAVLYLLSDKSNFITGETLLVEGGLIAAK